MIYLLRHGKPEACTDKRYLGQADIPISPSGLAAAKEWLPRFNEAGISFAKVYSSDLSRCIETAKAASGLPAEDILQTAYLREINLGDWDCMLKDEVKDRFAAQWEKFGSDISFRPPNGESFADVTERVFPILNCIRQTPGNKLVVSHAGVIRSLLRVLMDLSISEMFALKLDYAGLTLLAEGETEEKQGTVESGRHSFFVLGVNLNPEDPWPPAAMACQSRS